ncbi:hypothetical protein [Cellulosimicrobium composti]|uniref:hypothetical protein n=1 Tax=Cellulosimicrobium composti TaxID=2672572 RepID=UPI003799E4CD
MGKTLRGAAALTATAALTILGASTATAVDGADYGLVDDYLEVEAGEWFYVDLCANDTADHSTMTIVGPVGATDLTVGYDIDTEGDGCVLGYKADPEAQGVEDLTVYWRVPAEDGTSVWATSKLYVTIGAKAEAPVIAPAFALGGLALAGAGVGARTLTKRRRTS